MANQIIRAPIKLGDTLTKRDGTVSRGVSMTASPPHWLFVDGVAVQNLGDDHAAALEHYDRMTAQRRALLGIDAAVPVGVGSIL